MVKAFDHADKLYFILSDAESLVLYGDENARLNVPENFSLEERAEAAEDMLADVLESAA